MFKHICSLSTAVAVGLLSCSYGIAANNDSNVYTDPKLEIFNVQIVGPSGTVSSGIHPNDSTFVTKKALFPNHKVLKQNSENIKTTKGGYFFEYELPSGVDFTRKDGNHIVKSSDKIWNLATSTKSADVTIHQQIAAIYRKNLRCFPNGKLVLKIGCQLELPTPEQAKAEDIKISARLNKEQGVPIGDYTYGLTNCGHGVCHQKKIERSTTSTDGQKKGAESEKITFEQNHGAQVEYYKSEKDQKTEKKTDQLAPVTTINLVDRSASEQQNDSNETVNQNINFDPNAPIVAKGTTLTFSGADQKVTAKNKNGEVIAEVVHNYDEHIEKLKTQMNQSSSGNTAVNAQMKQEYQELKNEIAELKMLLRESAQRPVESKSEKESESSFFTILIGIILAGLAGVSLFFFAKIRSMNKAEDILEEGEKVGVVDENSDEENIDNEESELLANQVGEDNSAEIIAAEKAKILDARLKQESVVTDANDIVNKAAQNDLILQAGSISGTEIVVNNFSNRAIEKIDIDNNNVDEKVIKIESDTEEQSKVDEKVNPEKTAEIANDSFSSDSQKIESQPAKSEENISNLEKLNEAQENIKVENDNHELITEDKEVSTEKELDDLDSKSNVSDKHVDTNDFVAEESQVVNFEFEDTKPITIDNFETAKNDFDFNEDTVEKIDPTKENS